MALCFAVKNGGDRREPPRFLQKEEGRQPLILLIISFAKLLKNVPHVRDGLRVLPHLHP